jgi:hypothetical protein
MGSTFWAESYFRSLKRTNVLTLFTKYLLQYKRVCIPHVGTFELVQQSPRLDVADKLFTPPSFTTRYRTEDSLPEHQVLYFALSVPTEKERLKYELNSFGQDLLTRIEKDPFRWNGFGTLRFASNELVFEPSEIRLESLQGLRADRVVHPNISHNVLVGNQELTFADTAKPVDRTGYKMPVYLIIGWILLVLALAAIGWFLYTGNFQTGSSGLKMYFGN